MEQGKLNIFRSKKGKLIIEILFTNGKKMSAPSDFHLSDEPMNGKSVEVEREAGQIIKIICNNEVIYKKQTIKPKTSGNQLPDNNFSSKIIAGHIENVKNPARAPYNFVPLNYKVVEAEPVPKYNKYHINRITGSIELEIETITPLYIRDTLTQAQILEKEKQEKEGKIFNNPEFFSPNNRVRIPASSIRGMIRTLVEIISYGKFGCFEDNGLYYRGLADKSNLRQEYQKRMSSFDHKRKKPQYNMSAGYLYKIGFDYFIKPATGYEQILKVDAKKRIEEAKQEYKQFQYYKLGNECIVVSGDIQKKKRDWLIYGPQSNGDFLIPELDVFNYKNDKNRSDQVPNLIELAGNERVPCFYVRWRDNEDNERVSFGHTGMFRLAYEKHIKDHIPKRLLKSYKITSENLKLLEEENISDLIIHKLQELKNEDIDKDVFEKKINELTKNYKNGTDYYRLIIQISQKYDIAEAIFGNEISFASRVFVEDGFLDGSKNDVFMKEGFPKILSSPKKTTFQHYVNQNSYDIRKRNHYNSNSSIRGNKLYWHKAGNNWQEADETKIQDHVSQYTKIQPIKPNVKFRGKIRFENLSTIELGALLYALDLPDGCYHKLGMGKPLGLGSIKMSPKLRISNRQKRYTTLFSEWDSPVAQEPDIEKFKIEFAKAVSLAVSGEKNETLWDTKRMRELKVLLDFEKGKNLEQKLQTEYMELTDEKFKNRCILPLATEVTKKVDN